MEKEKNVRKERRRISGLSLHPTTLLFTRKIRKDRYFFFLISKARCINEETESYKVTKDRYTLSLVNYLNSQ